MRKLNHREAETFDHDNRLQTIQEIGRAVGSTLDLGALYDTIYEQVGRVMDTRIFFLGLVNSAKRIVELPYLREVGELFVGQEVPVGASVTSLVIERGAPLLFNTLEEYQSFGRANGLEDITIGEHIPESMIFVPLNTGNKTIGALSAQSQQSFAYSPDDVQTLSVIASQAAVAIENARLFLQSRNNVRRIQALLSVANMISSSLDLQTVLDSILEGMREVMPYFLAAILMPDHDNNVLEVVGAIGPLAEERRREIKIPFGTGVTGEVFASGEPRNIPNVTEFANYFPHGIEEVRSEMAVPLKRGDTVIGVLDVERDAIDAFPPEDVDMLMLFASQAAIAIENARLFAEQQSRVFELQTIQNIVQHAALLHDIPAIAGVIDRELTKLIDYQACRIFLLHGDHLLVPVKYEGSDASDLRLRIGQGLAGWIAQHGTSQIVRNTLQDERVKQLEGTPLREESMIACPLAYEGRVRGVISLSKLGVNQFDENSLRLLEIISAQAAIAFDRARLYAELRIEAITDPLTRLYNRRYLIQRLREERARARRNRHTLVAIMIDIDRFKRVNDTFGHDAGDLVLKELAGLIRASVRTEDVVARYGGEEFCVLLSEVRAHEAESIAERMRLAIESHSLPPDAGVSHITVSVGIARLEEDDAGTELFTRADQAMYQVKRRGGNRVRVARSEDPNVNVPSPAYHAGREILDTVPASTGPEEIVQSATEQPPTQG